MTRSTPEPKPPVVNNGNPTNPGTNPPDAKAKPELLLVPGGTFQMGRTGGPVQEGPAHSVTVAAFAMDKTEVTNAEYAEFVARSEPAQLGLRLSAGSTRRAIPPGRACRSGTGRDSTSAR